MAITSVTLVDAPREMVLMPRDGLKLQGLNAPFPAAREVVEQRTDDDGERDTTELFGATSCSIELLATQTGASFKDELGRFLHPRSRPYLVVSDDEWAQERRLLLRSDQFAAPLTVDLPPAMRRMQAQWKVPDGVWEAVDLVSETVNADAAASGGAAYPRTYPYSYAATTSAGASTLSNQGGTPAHIVARLYGPCTGPSLINETLGEEITFTDGLVLGSGEYVEVNTQDRSAYLNSSTSLSRLNYLDFEVSAWWLLDPGDQQVRYAPSLVSGAAAAVITYRPAWIT